MTLHTYHNIEQGSDEWLELRRGIVTASTVGSLITTRRLTAIDYECPKCTAQPKNPCVGLRDPGKPLATLHGERTAVAKEQPSPLIIEPASNDISRDLTTLLVSERITGWVEPTWVSDDMLRGHEDEPLARAAYAEHTGLTVTQCGFMAREEQHWKLGLSPDGLVGNDGLIEIKSRRPKGQLKTALLDGIPAEHMAQCQAAMVVSGRSWVDYVSFAGGMRLIVKRVRPNGDWRRAIVQAVKQFEENARELQRQYDEATAHMPMTERNPMITGELKLA